MGFDFPSSPTLGQEFAPVGSGATYFWNGYGWDVRAPSAGVAAGVLVELARQTVSAAVTNIDFTTGIDATYDEYEIHWFNVKHTVDSQLGLRISQDFGATWKAGASDYSWGAAFAVNSGSGVFGGANPATSIVAGANHQVSATNYGAAGFARFFGPALTTTRKVFLFHSYAANPSGQTSWQGFGSYGPDANAINGVRLVSLSGNFTSGTFVLYARSKSAVLAVPPPGTRILIRSQTVTSPVATVAFTGIDATYDKYEFDIFDCVFATDDNLLLRVSQDAGATWDNTNQYVFGHSVFSCSSGTNAAGGSGVTATNYVQVGAAVYAGAGLGGDWFIQLFRPWKTGAGRKRFIYQQVGTQATYGDFSAYGGGSYLKAGAFNGVRFQSYSGSNFTSGTFNLYGIKK